MLHPSLILYPPLLLSHLTPAAAVKALRRRSQRAPLPWPEHRMVARPAEAVPPSASCALPRRLSSSAAASHASPPSLVADRQALAGPLAGGTCA